MMKQRSR